MDELDATSHRPFSTGFFYGDPTQNPGDVDYLREKVMVATVVSCAPAALGPEGRARFAVEVVCRNKAQAGDELEAVCAGEPVRTLRLEGLEHHDALAGWERAGELSRAMERYRLLSPFPLRPLDVLRR